MKKFLIAVLVLLTAFPAMMQHDHGSSNSSVDCSAAGIREQAEALIADFDAAGDDEAAILEQVNTLAAALNDLQAACAIAEELEAIDYNAIAQHRLEDGAFVLGSPDAPVTIVEFADFACPHCQAYSDVMHQFIIDYVATGQARFEYRLFISGADPQYGTLTAKLAECAEAQQDGGFWLAHDVLFALGKQGRFNETTAPTLAERLGLDLDALMACTEDVGQVDVDGEYGVSLGVQSTPTIMVRVGDGEPQFVSAAGRDWTGGGLPYELLAAIVQQLNAQ